MAIHRHVLHNSSIREASEGMLTPGQLGLLTGWGVFSTVRVKRGALFAFERHWARMTRDAALLRVEMPESRERTEESLRALIEANGAQDSTLRLVVVRNGGGMWEGPCSGRASDVLAMTASLREWGAAMRLTYQPAGRYSESEFTRAKILSWAGNVTLYERAREAGFDECVLLNERGEVTECTSANLFAVKGSEVWTPPLSAGCLPGITREVLLEEVRVPGITIGERTLMPADLESADGVFATSSTRDLLVVSEIGGNRIKDAAEVRQALSRAFAQYLESYVEMHRPVDALRG